MSGNGVHGSARRISALAAVLLALLLCLPAQPLAGQASGRPASITVVSDDNYPPYIFRNDEGQLQGILVDQWLAWEQATGVRVELLAMDWERAKRFMREGQADVIDTIFFNQERAKTLDFTKPYARLEVPVFVHKTLGGISDPASLRGFTVGVKAGDAVVDELKRYGIHSLKEYNSYKDIIDAARTGDIRVFSIDAPPALYFLYKHSLESEFRQSFVLYTGEFHRAVNKGESELLALVEQGFADIPQATHKAIEEKWLGAPILSSQDLRLALYVLAGVAALALALVFFNITLRRRVRARTAELGDTLVRLRASEERFRTMVETSTEGIVRLDDKGLITYVNDTMARLLGLAPGDMPGRPLTDFMFPEDRPDHEARLSERRAGRTGRYERRLRTGSGGEVWTMVSASPVLDEDGRFVASFGMFTDITERRRAEEALKISENTLRSLFSSMTDIILILDAEGRYLEIAPTNTDRLYRPPAKLLGRSVSEVFPPEQAVYFLGVIRKALETGASVSTDYRLAIDGREYWFAGNVAPLTSDSVLWVARDITERKKAEQALFESRERLQLALDAANDGLWDWRLDTGEAYFSPRYYTMLGYEPGEFPANFESFTSLLHPDDLEAITRSIKTSLRDNETNAFEVRMRTKSGEWMWILTRSRVVDRDGSGAPTRLAGTHSDITERKQAEAALLENEALYRRFSWLGSDCFHSCVRRGLDAYQLLWIGGAVEKITGYTAEEVGGAGCFVGFVHQDDALALTSRLMLMKPGDTGESEFRLVRKDGSHCWVSEAVCCEQGELHDELRLFGTIKDITDRKRAEEALLASERRFSELIRYSSDSITILDADGTQVFVSQAVERMLGYSPAELMGIPVIETMIHPDDRGAVAEAFATIIRDGAGGAQYRHRHKDGSWIYLEAWGTNQLDNPDIRGVVVNVRDITERKAAEEALRESEAQLSQVQHIAHLGSWHLDIAADRLRWSDETYRIFGLQPQEFPATYEAFLETVHPADRAAVDAAFTTSLKSGADSYEIEHRLVRRHTGEVRHVHERCVHERNALGEVVGSIGMVLDITERKAAEEALRESEERYRSVIQNMQDIYYRTDAQGRLVMFSPSAMELLGYGSLEEMMGRPAETFYADPAERARFLARLRSEGVLKDYEVTLRRKDGSTVLVATTSTFYRDTAGTVLGVEGIFRDITERKLAEEALTRARDAADAASRAKSEFLANMSHEIRTPLNGIVGMIQLLNDSPLDEEQRRYSEAALLSSQRLTRLLGDILDLSRIEARKFVLERNPFRPGEVFESVDMLFRVPAAQKGVELALRLGDTLPEWLLGDEHRLRQVLFNLVGNAVKFTEAGQVEVEADMLSLGPEGECRVLFVVADTGVGMPDELLDQSFQMFTQAESALSRSHQGAGLGLAIVRHLVSLMGGAGIDVSSQVGEGTTFSFVLSFGLPKAEDVAGLAYAPPPPVPVSLQGLRVLLVEDEAINQLAVRTGLVRKGIEVTSVGSGEAALELLREGDFDCVLMDIQMPGMDGMEATQAIRTWPEFRDRSSIPVIALTAFAMTGDRERFLEAGMDDYLAKPYSFEDLAQILGRIRRDRAASLATD